MENREIVFEAPWKVSLRREDAALRPGANELLVKTLYSLISTGTELACLSGGEDWFHMPAVSGYCCVSKVLEAGAEMPEFAPGDVVFHYGSHSRYQLTAPGPYNLIMKVPEGLSIMTVPMVRMATIAFTAIRASDIQLGDIALVTGLGLVGNMAAQLARLSGATVIGVDPAPNRRALALKVGVDAVASPEEASALVDRMTGGEGCNTVIEATGIPACAEECLKYVGYHGEIIFLGTPRGNYQTNLANILRTCHLDELGCVNFKGAHEWRLPIRRDRYAKHSIERNTQICFDQAKKGGLRLGELVTHVLSPEEAAGVYLRLHENRNGYMGIIIDWER